MFSNLNQDGREEFKIRAGKGLCLTKNKGQMTWPKADKKNVSLTLLEYFKV